LNCCHRWDRTIVEGFADPCLSTRPHDNILNNAFQVEPSNASLFAKLHFESTKITQNFILSTVFIDFIVIRKAFFYFIDYQKFTYYTNLVITEIL
ncbi:MAG: hypothetical protein RLZ56_438, partial [Bacteroidota bacterium]